MKMKRLLLLPLLWCSLASAQVKIGDNPQTIGPASLLELESTDRVLVLTRVTTAQMEAITPSGGGLVYNTEEDCLFYHNGQRWINICEALGLSFTAEPIVNEFPTIAITRQGDTVNFEVGQIRGSNIVDFSISGQDIQDNVINQNKLADASVGTDELQDNAVTAAKIGGDVAGTGLIQNPAGALEVDVTAISGNGDIVSQDLVVGGVANALLGEVTLEIAPGAVGTPELANNAVTSVNIADGQVAAEDLADDAVTAEKLDASVVGAGLAQNAAGALEVDVTGIAGDGTLSSPLGTIALAGNPGNALFENVEMDVAVQNIISSDLNNDLVLGSDGAIYINVGSVQTSETITNLTQDINTGIINYINENGVNQTANIASSDSGNLLIIGSDGGGFINQSAIIANETTTSLVQNTTTGVITYTNENGVAQTANTTSSDTGNLLRTGTDGGSFIDQSAITDNETITSLAQDPTTGVITYTNEEGADQTANITSVDSGNLLITGSDGGSFIDQTVLDGTFATDTELSNIIPSGTQGSIFFSDGAGSLVENNAQLFWDNLELKLYVGNQVITESDVKLNVGGTIRTQFIKGASGSSGLPTYRFNDNQDTGMYLEDASGILAFSTNNIEALRIDNIQNVGIQQASPSSALHLGGSFATPIRSETTNVTLTEADHTVILETGVTLLTLPPADISNAGRIYIIKNKTGVNVPTNLNYLDLNGIASNDIAPGVIWLQSDGIGNWEQIN